MQHGAPGSKYSANSGLTPPEQKGECTGPGGSEAGATDLSLASGCDLTSNDHDY